MRPWPRKRLSPSAKSDDLFTRADSTVSALGQADALENGSQAKRRLADDVVAQEPKHGRREEVEASDLEPTNSDIGLTNQEIDRARQIRDGKRPIRRSHGARLTRIWKAKRSRARQRTARSSSTRGSRAGRTSSRRGTSMSPSAS